MEGTVESSNKCRGGYYRSRSDGIGYKKRVSIYQMFRRWMQNACCEIADAEIRFWGGLRQNGLGPRFWTLGGGR